jgi:hypothetical protein
MNAEEFREMLNTQTDEQLLGPCLHDEATPFVFDPAPASWDTFRQELVSALGISREDIRVIGSARFGFSLKPWRNLKPFSDTSDIDVVIVNPNLFDELWIALLTAAYPRLHLTRPTGGWLKRRKNEVYTGWLTPLDIRLDSKIFGTKAKPVYTFTSTWFNAFKLASRHPARRHEDINSRLYRTWQHAELYHWNSLSALRKSFSE